MQALSGPPRDVGRSRRALAGPSAASPFSAHTAPGGGEGARGFVGARLAIRVPAKGRRPQLPGTHPDGPGNRRSFALGPWAWAAADAVPGISVRPGITSAGIIARCRAAVRSDLAPNRSPRSSGRGMPCRSLWARSFETPAQTRFPSRWLDRCRLRRGQTGPARIRGQPVRDALPVCPTEPSAS